MASKVSKNSSVLIHMKSLDTEITELQNKKTHILKFASEIKWK